MAKSATSIFSIFLSELNGLKKLLIRLAFMSQLLEKKIKVRGGKKCHIKFPYSSVEPERTQRAFL
ncbi:conserved hypothetical protein [Carnobacterium maltaromaticum]|nr:conserved hypothetical protein [Carnobacterium maltaromaticum]